MAFEGEIIKDISNDPYFKLVFSYQSEKLSIEKGFAEVIRRAPSPSVIYDDRTIEKLDSEEKVKLDLEIMNTVVTYMLSKGICRTFRGNVVLQTA